MDIIRWSILKSDLVYSLQHRWRSSIQSAIARPRADCDSDHELLIAKFRLKLKKVGKSLAHDLNQIPYDYTMEVINRLERLDLIDRMPEELRMEISNTAQEVVIKTIPKEKKCSKAKMVVSGGLTNS